MLNRAALNYKNSCPLVISLRLSLHPDRTLGERIKKWRLEQGLFQVDLARMIGVSEMTIVNWEKGRTKPTEKNIGRLRELLGNDLPSFVKWRYSIERKGKPSTKKNFER